MGISKDREGQSTVELILSTGEKLRDTTNCPYLLGEEADVRGRGVLPGRLLLGQPLEFGRDHAWVVPSAV